MGNDELAQHLESLQREECYRVDAVLKESPVEVTQRVYFVGSNGAESGPYIRKFIRSDTGLGPAYQRMYEAQHGGHRFKHLPDILECYSRDGQMVVIMEFVRGETLQETVYRNDPSPALARNVFPLICDAVTELHTEFAPPIIHRDLKPSNIILTGQGLCLIDFGISREYREDADADTTHFGTREFAPPEQFGFGQTGAYSDVYSLGMVLYFCLTEQIPDSKARKQGFRDSRIPEAVRQVIVRATEMDPAKRYQSAEALKTAFEGVAGHATATAQGAGMAPGEATDASSAKAAKAAGRTGAGGCAKRLVIAAIVALACAGILVFASGCPHEPAGDPSSSTDASSANSPAAAASTDADNGQSSANSQGESATSSASELVKDIQTSGEPKDEFDPSTNVKVVVAGVEFQIPKYFLARTSASDDGSVHYYYAESGSSVAMVMTDEHEVGVITGEDFDAAKDVYVNALVDAADIFDEVTASTDYQLAGNIARVVTIRGSVQGYDLAVKGAFFFVPGGTKIGSLMFGQTSNSEFDYSSDFAKVLTSARPAA